MQKSVYLLILFFLPFVGCGLGFRYGLFIADYKDKLERDAIEWQLLDNPVKFTKIVAANSEKVWAQTANDNIYFWDFSCNSQQKCNQWVETKIVDTGLQYPLAKKNNTCLVTGESGLHPLKEPPGKIVECGQLNFKFYALLENGKIWSWEFQYPGDGLPNEVYISTFVGIILGIIASLTTFFLSLILKSRKVAQHRVHRTSAGRWPHFRDSVPMADSTSGDFVRQIPRLPVTPVR